MSKLLSNVKIPFERRTGGRDQTAPRLVTPEGCVAFRFEAMLCFVRRDISEKRLRCRMCSSECSSR
jgi:hypothetical protein